MKKIFLFISIVLILVSCTAYTGFYSFEIEKCDRSNNREDFGKLECNTKEMIKSSLLEIEDNIVKIFLQPNDEGFNLEITNKSEKNIKVIWDDCAIVKPNGESSKVIHKGIKYIDKEKSQNPSTIIKGSKLSDIIIPIDNITYISGKSGGWRTLKLYNSFGFANANWGYDDKELEEDSKINFGKNASILLTLQYDDINIEYVISTKITKFNTYKL